EERAQVSRPQERGREAGGDGPGKVSVGVIGQDREVQASQKDQRGGHVEQPPHRFGEPLDPGPCPAMLFNLHSGCLLWVRSSSTETAMTADILLGSESGLVRVRSLPRSPATLPCGEVQGYTSTRVRECWRPR